MSRSYKHTILCKDKNGRYSKSLSSRAVRRTDKIADGGAYKKLFCSWEICDYRYDYNTDERSLRKWMNEWERKDSLLHRLYPNRKQAYRAWLKCYKMK